MTSSDIHPFEARITGPDRVVDPFARRRPPKAVQGGALDFGLKENILKNLTARNCEVTVVPAYSSLEKLWRFIQRASS